ncbi:MAG TPA: zf-HC2 domain-containing protein [Bryobacteraceae bacterium]|nr:zf-HC2 domain-containing protein [Bryobacteraceae bacterium]
MESHNPEMLVAYAAGELDVEAASALERHLAECPACASLATEQATVWKALDAWEAPPVSPDFDRRLYRRIANEVHLSWWERIVRPFRPVALRQLIPVTATAGLLLMAGLVLRHQGMVAPPQARAETVHAEQVESTLDDLELLRQFAPASSAESVHPNAM